MTVTPSPAPTAGDDTIHGTFHSLGGFETEDEYLFGYDGNDTLYGNGGDDVFIEGFSQFPMYPSSGFDPYTVYDFGQGSDRLFGGDGYDEVRYIGSSDRFTVDLAHGEIRRRGQVDTLDSIELVTLGEGDDRVISLADGIEVRAGEGQDVLDFRTWTSAVDLNLATGVVSLSKTTSARVTGFEIIRGSNLAENAIQGSSASEVIRGGAFDDFLSGGGGVDRIIGGAGNDVLSSGSLFHTESDSIIRVSGGLGDDYIMGGSGRFRILAGRGNDRVDVLDADRRSRVQLGEGDDVYYDEGHGRVRVFGGNGNDTFTGGVCFGGAGADTFYYAQGGQGGAGDDTFYNSGYVDGGDGNDVFYRSGEASGGAGDDVFYEVSQHGISGGTGNDVVHLVEEDRGTPRWGVALDGGEGHDILHVGGSMIYFVVNRPAMLTNPIVVAFGFEEIVFNDGDQRVGLRRGAYDIDTLGGNDFVDIDSRGNTVRLGEGSDSAIIRTSNNVIYGDAGNDTFQLRHEPANIRIFAGAGRDTITNASEGRFFGGGGNDYMTIYAAQVLVHGGSGDDTVRYGARNFLMDQSGEGHSRFVGGTGNDTFTMYELADEVFLGAGNDTILLSGFSVSLAELPTLPGPMRLSTGTGRDVVQIDHRGSGQIIVTDLDAERDVFRSELAMEEWDSITDTGRGALLSYNDDPADPLAATTVLLVGITVAELEAGLYDIFSY